MFLQAHICSHLHFIRFWSWVLSSQKSTEKRLVKKNRKRVCKGGRRKRVEGKGGCWFWRRSYRCWQQWRKMVEERRREPSFAYIANKRKNNHMLTCLVKNMGSGRGLPMVYIVNAFLWRNENALKQSLLLYILCINYIKLSQSSAKSKNVMYIH